MNSYYTYNPDNRHLKIIESSYLNKLGIKHSFIHIHMRAERPHLA